MGSFGQLFIEATPVDPCYWNLAMQSQYKHLSCLSPPCLPTLPKNNVLGKWVVPVVTLDGCCVQVLVKLRQKTLEPPNIWIGLSRSITTKIFCSSCLQRDVHFLKSELFPVQFICKARYNCKKISWTQQFYWSSHATTMCMNTKLLARQAVFKDLLFAGWAHSQFNRFPPWSII